MPITSSAKKAVKVAHRRHQENLVHKLAVKKSLKVARKAIDTGTVKSAQKLIIDAQSNLDKAVKTKLLHRNTASRLLSRLTKRVAAAK